MNTENVGSPQKASSLHSHGSEPETTPALRSCPFCGGPADIFEDSLFGFCKTFAAECTVCGCRLYQDQVDEESAAAAWNSRANDGAQAQNRVLNDHGSDK